MPGSVTVFGSFMMDLIAYVDRRPVPGETVRGSGFTQTVGGKGFNQAVAARRAGAETTMVGRLGTDVFGDQFIGFLAAEGIDAAHVTHDEQAGTGVGMPVVESGGGNSIVIVPRANDCVGPPDAEAAREQIAGADVLLLQLEVPEEASIAAARIAQDAGTLVILNPAPLNSVPDELLPHVDVLIPNEIEAAAMIGHDSLDAVAIGQALREQWQLDVAVVTLGADGAIVCDADGSAHIDAFEVEAIDTVGAGDTFCGAFAAAIADGQELTSAATFASVAAGISVTRRGGAPSAPSQAEILRAQGASPTISSAAEPAS